MSDDEKPMIDTWGIIDTYFRDTEYYKSQHQLDSYDEFIYSETNGIQHIIKRGNPLRIYKEAMNSDATEFKYEIEIYFGETLNEEGLPDENENTILVSVPTEYTEDIPKYMYPNIARLKGYTYKSNIFCSIGIKYKNNEANTIFIRNFPKVNIGSIPIMVHSKRCVLRGLDEVKLSEFGECPYDQGGYFIINGKEKVILSQEIKVNNVLYINSSSDDGIILQATIKSISKEGFQSSRTNHISLEEKKINIKDIYKVKLFKVRVLGFDIKIPLVHYLLRILIMKTYEGIFRMSCVYLSKMLILSSHKRMPYDYWL
jgi:DNA-directed RNA polymerase II subunit RPB2